MNLDLDSDTDLDMVAPYDPEDYFDAEELVFIDPVDGFVIL